VILPFKRLFIIAVISDTPKPMYVGDISEFFQNTITTTCGMAPAKRRSVKTASLIALTSGILEIFSSAPI